MRGLRSALGFLTILPVSPEHTGERMAAGRAWFPVVGFLLGAGLVAVDLALRLVVRLLPGGPSVAADGLPPVLVGGILVGVMAVLTRGLHLDGFMDTCDALGGGLDRERRLEILRDPHAGAFAVAGVVILLLVKASALGALPPASRYWTIIVIPGLARCALLVAMEGFPYVRPGGLGSAFQSGARRGAVWVGMIGAGLVTVALIGPVGLVLVAMAGLAAWMVGVWATRLLGGLTGDVYGAVVETTETLLLVAATAVTLGSPAALQPVWWGAG